MEFRSPSIPGSLFPARELRSSSHRNGSGWRWRFWRGSCEIAGSTLSTVGARTSKLARLEAALFVAEGALSARKLAQAATLVDAKEVALLIDELNSAYDRDQSAFRVERVAAGFQLLTRPVYAAWLDRAHHRQERLKLSASTLETLAVIAYRQPCTRADVEAVRGVQCAELIKQLMERNLVRVAGEDDSLGRPYLYATTRLFLESFGLSRLEDLPLAEALRKQVAKPALMETADPPKEATA